MWYTDVATRGGCCLSPTEDGDSLCGGYTCHMPIDDMADDTNSYDSLWEVIAEDDVHGSCAQPLADVLGFEDYDELRDYALERQEVTA